MQSLPCTVGHNLRRCKNKKEEKDNNLGLMLEDLSLFIVKPEQTLGNRAITPFQMESPFWQAHFFFARINLWSAGPRVQVGVSKRTDP
jgi:hypothetical protein